MTFDRLIELANEHYPDGLVERAYRAEEGEGNIADVGDTLAVFIVRELRDTFDRGASEAEQLIEASSAILKASHELTRVGSMLLSHHGLTAAGRGV